MRRIWTPRWVLVHALALVLVVTFLWLGWWQLGRAASGNLLSYGYSIQWPAFAAFVIFVWFKEIRGTLRRRPEQDDAGGPAVAPGPNATGNDTSNDTAPPRLDRGSAGSEATGPEEGRRGISGPVSARAQASARGAVSARAKASARGSPPARAQASAKSRERARGSAYDDSDDPQLAAYNRYLAWLNENPHANPADYPGN